MVYEQNINKRYLKLCRAILERTLYDAGDTYYFYRNDEREFLMFLTDAILDTICTLADINVERYRELLAKRLEKGLGGVKIKRVKYGVLKGVLHESSRVVQTEKHNTGD